MRPTSQRREERIADLAAEAGPDWAADFRPGTFGCHELLDRTNGIADRIEAEILSHPACVQNPEWFALAEQAAATLCELYQRIGAEHLSREGT